MTDRLSPLHDEHVALGAALTSFAGWQMPLRYSSDLAEHTAVRTAAGLFDLSHMGEIEVTGPDAGAFLDAALGGALATLRVHGARYTMIAAEDGGVVDDLVVYRTAEDAYLVVANASNHEGVLDELRAAFGDVVVPLEAMLPHGAQADAACVEHGVEHGIHVVDSLAFQARRAVSDPEVSVELGMGDDDVVAAVRETFRWCVEHPVEVPVG